jgi:hypothetical protein
MLKAFVLGVATFGFMAAASAADLPHPQPVAEQAPIGKMPIGKSPIGKAPIGKYPVGKAPIVTKG